jgi:hypothetical protein
MNRQDLATKYQSYQDQGHLVLSVTLSTYIKSARYAHSDRTRYMWDHHFIRRVERRLPFKAKNKFDHDYLMEESPEGCWHYHGLIAVPSQYSNHLWKGNVLHPQLGRDIYSFRRLGSQRLFKINSFLIEPVKSVDAWCSYITKQQYFLKD